MDTYSAPDFPGRPGFEGFTLRLSTRRRASGGSGGALSYAPGEFDEPVVGRFEDGVGLFECDDILGGIHVRVRYEWRVIDENTLRWEQSFSFNGRRTWDSNWVMESTRIASAVPGAAVLAAVA